MISFERNRGLIWPSPQPRLPQPETRGRWWLKALKAKKKGESAANLSVCEIVLGTVRIERDEQTRGERHEWVKRHINYVADLYCSASALTNCSPHLPAGMIDNVHVSIFVRRVLARVPIFMPLFVFLLTCLNVTSGPQLECSWLQLVLNLHPAPVTDTKLVVARVSHSLTPLVWPLCFAYSCRPQQQYTAAGLLKNDLYFKFSGNL